MVTFKEDRYIIEVYTGSNPIESWLNLQNGLLSLICNVNQDNIIDSTFYVIPAFLQELLPDWEIAKKMTQ